MPFPKIAGTQVHGCDQCPLPPLWNSFVGAGIHNGPVPPAILKYGYESKLCMERSALFRTYGTKGFRNWSCSGHLECDEI